MNPLPVSISRLANSAVRFQDAALANCALLPLFDGRGVTAKVVLLSADTREYRVVDWWPGLVHVPLLGAACVDMLWAQPQRAATGKPLWFYDRQSAATPFIRNLCDELGYGNCAGVLPKRVAGVFWWRENGLQFGGWKPDWLPAAPPEPMVEAPVRPAHGWVLHPAWAR